MSEVLLDCGLSLNQPYCDRPRDGRSDLLHHRLVAAHMVVTHHHAGMFVTEQAGDDRQRDAPPDGVTNNRVSKVMQSHILHSDVIAYQLPETVMPKDRPCGDYRTDSRMTQSSCAGGQDASFCLNLDQQPAMVA